MAEPFRINVALEGEARQDFEYIKEMSLLNGPADVVRRSLAVFADLLWAHENNLEIVLRHRTEKTEWAFSPHVPRRVVAIVEQPSVDLPVKRAARGG